ncbi:hypothetical protein [Enterococcus sp. AZ109]|uniref:hypothetical protein n=1 Tax=Enterococcus sp. AZ109 TaxID=2774634 RepID=UPI003F24EE88
MLDLKMIGFDGINYTYHYYPEGDKNAPGEVIVNTSSNEIIFSIISEEDRHERYAVHVWSRLNMYLKQDKFLAEDLVAWG